MSENWDSDRRARTSIRFESNRAARRGEYEGFGTGLGPRRGLSPARLADGNWAEQYIPIEYPSGPEDYHEFVPGTYDIDRFWSVLSVIDENIIENHANFWRECGHTLRHFSNILEGRGAALRETWEGDAADMFMERVGAAKFSMDEWQRTGYPISSELNTLAARVRSAKADLFDLWYHYQWMLLYLANWPMERARVMLIKDPAHSSWELDFSVTGFVVPPALPEFMDALFVYDLIWPSDQDPGYSEADGYYPVTSSIFFEGQEEIAGRYHQRAADIFQPVADAMVEVGRTLWVQMPMQFYGHTSFNEETPEPDIDSGDIGAGVPGIDLSGGGMPGMPGMPDLPRPDLDALGAPASTGFAGGPIDSQLASIRAPADPARLARFLGNLLNGTGPPAPPLPDWMSLPVNGELARLAGLPENMPTWQGTPATLNPSAVNQPAGNVPIPPPAGLGVVPPGAVRTGGGTPGGTYGAVNVPPGGSHGSVNVSPGGSAGATGTYPGGVVGPDGVAPGDLADPAAGALPPGVFSTEPQNPALPGATGPTGLGIEQGIGQGMMPPPMMPPMTPPMAGQPGRQQEKSGPSQAGQGAGGMVPPMTPGLVPPGTVSQRAASPTAPQQRSAALPGTAGRAGRPGARGSRAGLRGLAGRGRPAATNPAAAEPGEDDLWATERAKGPLSGVAPPAPVPQRRQVADHGKGTLSGVASPAADQAGRPAAAPTRQPAPEPGNRPEAAS